MALRDQPYFPLYVKDFLTDEKLNNCSAASQGIYIKILCILHKQSNYGKILFKQNFSKGLNRVEYFATILSKQLTFDFSEILPALTELIEEDVLQISEEGLSQKRMVKDFNTSIARSEAAKKGGGNPILFKQKDKHQFKQKDKQNTEYENEYENEIVIENRKRGAGEKPKANPEFQPCMKVYHDFILKQTGAPPKITAADGKAMKDIIEYLEKFPNAENKSKSVNQLLEYILQNFNRWDQFHKKQIKLPQISSNLINIVNGLKNGQSLNGTTEQKIGRLSATDAQEFLNRGAIAPLD